MKLDLMHRILIVVALFTLLSIGTYAQHSDSIPVEGGGRGSCENAKTQSRWDRLMTWDFMALPYASFAPETSFNFGLTGVGYFNMPNTTQYSDVTFEGGYSLEEQWYINMDTRLNFNSTRRWFIDFRLNVEHYPDKFYGIGSSYEDILDKPIDINDNYVYFNFCPQFYVSKNWIVGAILNYKYSNTTTDVPLDSLSDFTSIDGFGEIHLLGLGASVSYDSRTNTYYPLKGLFFKGAFTYYEPFLGSSYRMGYIDTDFRTYIPLYKEFLLALQVKSQWALGSNKPYQLMPTLGGADIIRGIRGNTWKNDVLIAAQAEFRIPIWRFLKAAAFISAGDVYSLSDWKWNTLKIGYGVGLRACIHDARMNIRFDVARQNYDDNWSFYFTVKEAF